MGNEARKFIPRAPRYTLRPTDNRFFRYAHNDERGQSYTTQLIDISMSGMAFVTDRVFAPDVSEIIKVEIPIGENGSIAWFARVVRLEEYAEHKWYLDKKHFPDEHQVLVAVRFHELPAGHEREIKSALDKKFHEVLKENRKKQFQQMATYIAGHVWQITIYGICIALSVWFMWLISRPSENYDAQKGAPWGQRYPWLNFFTPPEEKAAYEEMKFKMREQNSETEPKEE